MTMIMVKKLLAGGEPCKKCGQAEDMLRKRGLWQQIDRVVIADVDDPESEGMQMARKYKTELAPFFIDERDGRQPVLFTSAIRFAKHLSKAEVPATAKNTALEDIDDLAERLEGKLPQDILRVALERHGAACAISFSGAEDVVLIDMASQLGLEFSVFSLDTGRLHAETYRFIDKVRTHYGIEIRLMAPDATLLESLVRKKGLFSFYDDGHKECCSIRKVGPLRRALAGFDAQVTGQRKDQSVTRVNLPVAQVDPVFSGRQEQLFKFNPLANWSSATVWQYIRDNDVPYNALHDKGFMSIGCEPCTRPARPGEHERAGRWWWEEATRRECGLHIK